MTRKDIYEKLRSVVGQTPLTKLFTTQNNNTFYAKLEYANFTGSHHDRQYVDLIQKLEDEGKINPSSHLIEVTSGNAGTSFAWVCSELGYDATVIVPSELPQARVDDIRRFGAKIVVSEGDYILGSVEKLKELLTNNPNFFCVNHSRSKVAVETLTDIAKEALAKQSFGVYVGVIGSGSSILAIGEYMKGQGAKIYGWEPFGSAHAYELRHPGLYEKEFGIKPGTIKHQIYGASFSGIYFPHIIEALPYIDEIMLVTDSHQESQYGKSSNLPNLDDVHWPGIGRTSLGNLRVCHEIDRLHRNENILTVFYDPSWKY